MADTVTVKRYPRPISNRIHQQVTLHFSKLPGQDFGPYVWMDAVTDLTISALLTRIDARSLVLDALTSPDGQATTETG